MLGDADRAEGERGPWAQPAGGVDTGVSRGGGSRAERGM